MAGIFDKVKKGVSVAGGKSAALVEAGKTQAEIVSLKQKKKNKLQEIGEKVYDMMTEDKLDAEQLQELFKEIQEIDESITEKEEEKSSIK